MYLNQNHLQTPIKSSLCVLCFPLIKLAWDRGFFLILQSLFTARTRFFFLVFFSHFFSEQFVAVVSHPCASCRFIRSGRWLVMEDLMKRLSTGVWRDGWAIFHSWTVSYLAAVQNHVSIKSKDRPDINTTTLHPTKNIVILQIFPTLGKHVSQLAYINMS